mmetsp:Transcript_94/g.121  ORF Transcript_94/g.121 Transcript_94/m.121 type:complete len:281 (+) Transcript_94:222-1064(+)
MAGVMYMFHAHPVVPMAFHKGGLSFGGLVADQGVRVHLLQAFQVLALYDICGCSGHLVYPDGWSEQTSKDAWERRFQPRARPFQALHHEPHGTHHEVQREGNATDVSCSCDDCRFQDQHGAALVSQTRLLRVALGLFPGHLLTLSVPCDQAPLRHRGVHENDPWHLSLCGSLKNANVGEAVHLLGLVLASPHFFGPGSLPYADDNCPSTFEQFFIAFRLEGINASFRLDVGAQITPGAWVGGAADSDDGTGAPLDQLPADCRADEAASAEDDGGGSICHG